MKKKLFDGRMPLQHQELDLYDFHLNREHKFNHHSKETKTVFTAANKAQRLIHYLVISNATRPVIGPKSESWDMRATLVAW